MIPARNEADCLPDCLGSVAHLDTDRAFETIVVDGDSDDRTPAIAREHDATLIEGPGEGIGTGRSLGAEHAEGEWLAFVDDHDLDAATSRCGMDGIRPTFVQVTINLGFPLERPILPGFDVSVDREVYGTAGGFPDVPNEDTAFSRHLGREHETASPKPLVKTSGRRIHEWGLAGTLLHYVRLDLGRILAADR